MNAIMNVINRHKAVLATPLWFASAILAGFTHSFAASLFVTITLILGAGAAIGSFAKLSLEGVAYRLVFASAAGSATVMLVGAIYSTLGHAAGIDRPLDRYALAPFWFSIALLISLIGVIARRDPLAWLTTGLRNRDIWVSLAVAPLPIFTAIGAALLNAGGAGSIAMATVLVIGATLLAFTLVASRRPNTPIAPVIFATVLSLAWTTALRGQFLFGWDIKKEYSVALETLTRGRWVPPIDGDAYASMLSITSLPAQLRNLAGFELTTSLRVVFPMLLAMSVVAAFLVLRRWASTPYAMAALVLLTISGPSVVRPLPAIARQEAGTLIFAAMMLILSDGRLSVRLRRVLLLSAAFALAFTHYTSSYAATIIMLLAALFSWITSKRSDHPSASRASRVLIMPVIVGLVAVTAFWNIGVTAAGLDLAKFTNQATTDGLELLPERESGSVWKTWLAGTANTKISPQEYRSFVEDRVRAGGWIRPDEASANVELAQDTAPTVEGTVNLPGARSAVAAAVSFAGQITNLLVLVGFLWRVRRRRADTGSLPERELLGLVFGALCLAALLRLSGTAANWYNPERAALQAGLVYGGLLAFTIQTVIRKCRIPATSLTAGLLALVTIGAWGFTPALVGGNPSASYSSVGEDSERFAMSTAENHTIEWMTSAIKTPVIVNADRYGNMQMLTAVRQYRFIAQDVIDPIAVDRSAYIYLTRTNLLDGRARGLEQGRAAVFAMPLDFYERTRAAIYSTEETRVYR